MLLFVLSLETAREAVRAERMEDVRVRPDGEEGSEVSVVRREERGFGEDAVGRAMAESSVEEDSALEVFIVGRALPWRREGGGGGGALWIAVWWGANSWLWEESMGGRSVECCEDMVREELLRDRLPVVELRNWLCRLARGTGGGTFFCGRVGAASDMLAVSLSLVSASDAVSSEASCEMMCTGAEVGMGGVGGSGLFRSEFVLLCSFSSGVTSATEKSSKGTVCGVRSFTSFP